MKVKFLVSMAPAAQNAGDEIDVDDATAKRFIERNIAEPIASKPAKETAEKKAPRKRKAVKRPHSRWFWREQRDPWGLYPRTRKRE